MMSTDSPQSFDRCHRTAARKLSAAGVEDAGQEARQLLCFALGWGLEQSVVESRKELSPAQTAAIGRLVERRAKREPLQYIMQQARFWGRQFYCDADVMIPRPETEMVVERALERLGGRPDGRQPAEVADLCTGSGVLAITIKLERPDCRVWASDISARALSVARRNARQLGASVDWERCPLFGAAGTKFDLVLSNPPYIPGADIGGLAPEIQFEPRLALDGGQDGMAVVGELLAELAGRLNPEGSALIEIGPEISEAALLLARRLMPEAEIAVEVDFSNLERLLVINA